VRGPLVLVPTPDWWRERPVGTSANAGRKVLMSSGSKKKELRCTCMCEAKALHSQRMWAEVSSSAPHLLHSGLSDSPIK